MAKSKIVKTNNVWTTIWTNPNPNQSFANNQIINIDLSAYSEVCFVIKSRVTGSAKYYRIVPIGAENTIVAAIAEMIWERYSVDVKPSYINFGVGTAVTTYNKRTEDTSVAIPLEVWAK